MLIRLSALLILSANPVANSAPPVAVSTMDVWHEGKMPGNGAKDPETDLKRDDGFRRITQVSRPSLTLFSAAR